jgi:hypothetical protein
MTRAKLTYRRPMLRPSTFAATLAITVLSLWNSPSRADLLATCGPGTAIICAATDVGKPCQGGGECLEVRCEASTGPTSVYNCVACPALVHAPSGTCTIANMGTACGDGDGGTGTCGAINPSCNTTSDKYVCQGPAGAAPTGPPPVSSKSDGGGDAAGNGAAGSGSGGCDVMPRPPKPGTLAIVLIVFGGVFLIVDRLRRRKR